MTGLLSRAREIRRSLGLSAPVSRDTSGPAASKDGEFDGVSDEELQTINQKIDQVASANRIAVSKETFKLSSAKSGAGLPILVNFLSAAVLAGGIALMFFLFRQNETSIEQEVQTLSSTEGRLLEVLRQEAQANLAAKEAEIAAIQNQLQQIQNERNNLQADFDNQLASRERQLRTALDAELEQERQRLREQGLSTEEIEEQIARIRQEKEQALNQALQNYRNDLLAERERAEALLAEVEADAAANLAAANDARGQLEAEARQRQSEFEAQLEAARRESQDQVAQADQQVIEAQQALAELSRQRDRETQLENQLNGFYSQIRTHIQNERFEQAQTTLELLRNFLNSEQFLSVDSLRQRRDTEVFLANALDQIISAALRKNNAQSASIAESATLISEIRGVLTQAQAAAGAGQQTQAIERYRQAIDIIPELGLAYDALLAVELNEAQTRTENQMREENEQAIRERQLSAQEEQEALRNEYQRQLEDLQLGLETQIADLRAQVLQRDQRIGELEQALADLDAIRIQLGDEVARLNSSLENSETSQDQQDSDFISLQQELNNSQNQLQQTQTELEEAKNQLAQLEEELATTTSAVSDEGQSNQQLELELIASKSEADELRQEIRSLNSQLDEALDTSETDALRDKVTGLEQQITGLQEQIDALEQDNRLLDTALDEATLSNNRISREASTRIAELQNQISQLSVVVDSYEAMVSSYQRYRSEESRLLQAAGGLLEGKVALDRFLADEDVQQAFPGLLERIQAYDQAFQNSGQEHIVYSMADEIYAIYSYPNTEGRLEYIDSQITQSDDAALREFYENMRLLIGEQE